MFEKTNPDGKGSRAEQRKSRLSELIAEGNDFVKTHQEEDYAFLIDKVAEYEAACKKNHGYFRRTPETKEILEEKAREYQMVHGTRFSPRRIGNRFLNFHGND